MIIFGTRSKSVAAEKINIPCNHCQSDDSVWIYVYRHYFHIFWIPAFPLWSSAASECNHCKRVLRTKEFDKELHLAYQKVRKSAKTPWWMYFWLLLVGSLVVVAIIIGIVSKNS